MTDSSPRAAARPAAIAFIFVTVVLDVVAMGIIIPVLPKLVEQFMAGDTGRAATMFGVFGTVWALMQFICSPIIGMLSDRYGRRRVILLSNFGLGLDYAVMALAPTLGWLFVGRVISGITGASWTAAGAYIADVSPPEKRAQGFGILGAAFGLGFVLGPALGGLLGAVDPRLPFWVAAGLTLVNALYGLFVLPESLPPEKRIRSFQWSRANPVGSLTLLRSHHELLGLAAVNVLYFLAHNVLPSVFVLYAGYRYGWDARAVGLTLAAVGVCTMIVQGGLVKPAVRWLGERRALLVGLFFGTVSFVIWGVAPTGMLGCLAIPFGALMGFYGPSSQTLMSQRVSAQEQGQLQGANSSVMGITGMIGPALFTLTFAYFIGPHAGASLPGAPFLLAALMTLLAMLLAWRVTRVRPALVLLIVLACVAAPLEAVRAQGPTDKSAAPNRLDTGIAVRALVPPVVDGRDHDEVWKLAAPMAEFRQFDPGENLDPTFRTEIRAAYDDRYLYVLVRAFDPHPDSILGLLSRRDVKTSSDQIKIIIDAYRDGRSGVEMAVNPAGVKRDYSIYSDAVEDQSWDGVWDAGTSIDSLGWVAEFRVPFSQLRFSQKAEHEFGFGVWRDVARLNERDAWPLYRLSIKTLISQLGVLRGIRGIAPARRLELLPYAVAKSVPDVRTPPRSNSTAFAGGIDIKAGLSSNVTVDATVNPDFGQVEADPSVLNLSAFEIRFDEKRPFFQEGVGLYKCGGPCEGPFYTRRVGRTPQLRRSSADPAFTTILGAAKLTGRFENGVAIGVVDAITRREVGAAGTTVEPQTNYFVARALREMRGGRSQLGLMFTNVARSLDAASAPSLRQNASTLILQGLTRFARDEWELMSYTGLNHVEGSAAAIAATQRSSVHYFQRPDGETAYDPSRTSLSGYAIGTEVKKIRGSLQYGTFFRYATPGLEINDLGLVPLVNDVQLRQTVQWQQFAPNRLVRSMFVFVSGESHWTTGGLPAARQVTVHGNAILPSNWGGVLTWTLSDIGGVYCVACARGGPALRQSLKHGLRLDLAPDQRPAMVPHAVFRVGRNDEGRSWYRGAETGLDVRVASRFSATVYGSYDRVANDQQWVGNYGALLSDSTHYTFARLDQDILALTARANWTATPTLSLQLYAQPFVTTGTYSNWRQLAAPRAAAYANRFAPYGNAAVPAGFSVKQFNSNVVLRWEYQPASVFFVVWQQGRSMSDPATGAFDASRDVRDLFASHPDNTVLLKLSYWFNP